MTKAKKNPAYRTKEELVKDVTIVLNAPLTYGTKKVVCWQAASEWTEHSGKYKGCTLWSKKAVEQYKANSNVKNLRHEHAVPKQVAVPLLMKLRNPSEKDVETGFELMIGVVVTLDEEKLLNSRYKSAMPPEFTDASNPMSLDPLLRYKRCGIDVVTVQWQDKNGPDRQEAF